MKKTGKKKNQNSLLFKSMLARVISAVNQENVVRQLKNIKVDEYGIKIMSPKADFFLIKLNSLPSMAANILKQEMLSLGGDVAISRQSITGKDKHTGCLIIGNLSQIKRLIEKLKMQPFQLNLVARNLSQTITNYKKEKFLIECGDYRLTIKQRPLIMGIVNMTTDSFSGDGLLAKAGSRENSALERFLIDKVEKMITEGADLIDIGAESSRPNARPLDKNIEIKRITFCLKALRKRFKISISVDTYKPQVAKVALDLGASIINDITGLRNVQMKEVLSRYKCGVVIMHMKGMPATMQRNPRYNSVVDEILSFLANSIDSANSFGISAQRIIIDPGIGFGKNLEHNLEILANLKDFKILGRPILLGVSRKSFIGNILQVKAEDRLLGTAAAIALSIREGADILRVHDVKQIKQTIQVCNAILRSNRISKYI